MCCGNEFTQEQKAAAYQAFTNTTGLKPFNYVSAADAEQDQSDRLFILNSFYFFIPVMILILIIIWIFVGTGRMAWAVGLFFSVLTIIILYGFSVAYRIAAENSYHRYYQGRRSAAQQAQQSYQDSVAYWFQGILAASCAITCQDDCDPTDCWTCNPVEPDCGCTGNKSCNTCRVGDKAVVASKGKGKGKK